LAEPRIHPSGAEYASWWSRVGAQLIDILVLAVPFGIIAALVASATDDASLWTLSIVFTIASVAYDGVLDGGPRGQTLGKRVLGIRVIDDGTGASIGYGRGVGRSVFMNALSLPGALIPLLQPLPLVDILWPLWDQRRQCWHDKAVGSVVVRQS
jgi:uncharacterized RDD family membrane protein YckC